MTQKLPQSKIKEEITFGDVNNSPTNFIWLDEINLILGASLDGKEMTTKVTQQESKILKNVISRMK